MPTSSNVSYPPVVLIVKRRPPISALPPAIVCASPPTAATTRATGIPACSNRTGSSTTCTSFSGYAHRSALRTPGTDSIRRTNRSASSARSA